ncbi:MAG: agmatine deiminase family protein [Bacteroidales bacterium]|nr:agmatine deiminase family protein [Bacteroidales bacterium]
MKPLLSLRLAIFILLTINLSAFAQKPGETNPPGLKHWMTGEELSRKNEIGKGFVASDEPTQPIQALSEFGRKKGVLIRYPFGISYALIKEMSMEAIVYTIVSNQTQENTVRTAYTQNGVNLSNCEFIHAPTNSYWTRDYGPFFIATGNEKISIVDFPYNRPRPYDDAIPAQMANYLGLDLYNMNVIHTGGNYMTDGMGVAASTDLVLTENPTLTQAQINQRMNEYLGITTYYVVPDPNNTYIDHIDCWAKFLDVDKILIQQVPPTHPQYSAIEAAAAYWSQQTSSYGTPYQIFRVNTPNNEPYTNSLILNKKVLVPIKNTSNDAPALAVYQQAMPGYTVLGFTGSWESTDALHCRAKEVPDPGMLQIRHKPLHGSQLERNQHTLTAEIVPYSGQSLKADSLFINYSYDGSQYNQAVLNSSGNFTFTGQIPFAPAGSEVKYFLSAADNSGRRENHPFIGQPDPHHFQIIETLKQQLPLHQNWTAISTHLLPYDDLEFIFAPVLDELIFVQNGSEIWWPEMGINTITGWDEKDCLVVKLAQPGQIEVLALEEAGKSFALSQGWNVMPVLSTDEVNIEQLFLTNINKVIVVKELAGYGVFWPEKQINTIGTLIPGKVYQVKVTEGIEVTFPE